MAQDKAKAIRCMVDVAGIPPSRFALPDDGRQRKHLCEQRWRLAVILARRAERDGQNTYQSITTLVALTEIPKRTLHRLLDDLERLGVLENHNYHPKLHTRVRSLHLAKLNPEIIGFEEDATVPSSGSENEVTVPSSGSTVPSSGSTVPSSGTSVPKSAAFGTHTALEPPTDRPLSPGKIERENLCSYSQIARWLPDDMKAAQKRNGEKARIDALISEHGGARFLAALKHHWAMQDPDSKLSCKWTAFLENFEGWIAKVTAEELQEQAQERWRKDHPEEWEQIQQESMHGQARELAARYYAGKGKTDEQIEAERKAAAEELAQFMEN